MNSRRASRIVAFKIITQREIIGENTEGEEYLLIKSRLTGKYLEYSQQLVAVAENNKKEILQTVLENPDSKRHYLHSVRALCLIAVAELTHLKDTPPKVVINEWVEICKSFVGSQHTVYCNGVLNRVLKMGTELKNT